MRPPKQKQPLANRRLSSAGSRLKTPKNGISTGIACCGCQTRGPVKEEKICMDKEHQHTLGDVETFLFSLLYKTKNHSKEEQRKAYPCNINLKYIPLKIKHV